MYKIKSTNILGTVLEYHLVKTLHTTKKLKLNKLNKTHDT